MQIYFSPELLKPDAHILNIVDQNKKAVGSLTIVFDEKKLYTFGNLEEEGVKEDFKDLIEPYIQGLSKSKKDVEIYSYLSVGGEKLDLNEEKEEKS